MSYAIDCKYFNGYKPCEYQKKDKSLKCSKLCQYYSKSIGKILVIKKGAIGEVLRCTALLRRLKKEYPNHEIWRLTDYPDILNKDYADKIIKFTQENIFALLDIDFDIVYSLDKEIVCCSLANKINAKKKKGFYVKNFKILPIDQDAEYLWRRGIDDEFMKNDKRHYLDEIFEVCGFKFAGERYVLPEYEVPQEVKSQIDNNKIVVGLNTGTSGTWKTRLWPEEYWIYLASKLIKNGYGVILLGGSQEDKINKRISEKSGAKYFGVYPFKKFIGIVSLTDIVVTQVTFAMHVATGLGKRVVLMNNIFNKNEYYFFNVPYKIIEPSVGCKMCYKTNFDEYCEVENCMKLIKPEDIYNAIEDLVSK